MIAFYPTGALLSFTSASSAPTSVQATTLVGQQAQQVCITNTDTANDAVIGWGATDAIAKLNAAAGTTVYNCYYVLHGQQVIVSVPQNSFFSGIAVASTAVIKVQAGVGLATI